MAILGIYLGFLMTLAKILDPNHKFTLSDAEFTQLHAGQISPNSGTKKTFEGLSYLKCHVR